MSELKDYLNLDFSEWKCRCSGIFNLMSGVVGLSESEKKELKKLTVKVDSGKVLTELQGIKFRDLIIKEKSNELPTCVKTYIEGEVDKALYRFTVELDTKEMDKGTNGENESIEIHNSIHFTSYRKANLPKSNEFLTTETCDIDDSKNDLIVEIKTPWSKKTFPKTKAKAYAAAKKAGYHYQVQGSMSIYGRSKATISYGLIDTPENLCAYEDDSMHLVEHLPMELRNTTIDYEHSDKMELQIYNRVVLVRVHMQVYYEEILRDHGLIKKSA